MILARKSGLCECGKEYAAGTFITVRGGITGNCPACLKAYNCGMRESRMSRGASISNLKTMIDGVSAGTLPYYGSLDLALYSAPDDVRLRAIAALDRISPAILDGLAAWQQERDDAHDKKWANYDWSNQ